MATLALPSVLTEMDVVLRVAGDAPRIELHFIGGALVAARTGELPVRAFECEARLLAVVEFPDAPAVRRMAARTVLAEATFVHVVGRVTGVALVTDVLVGACHVALLAWHGDVHTHQREVAEVVIEQHVDAPALDTVTARAVGAELRAVYIAGAMTADAVSRQPLRGG